MDLAPRRCDRDDTAEWSASPGSASTGNKTLAYNVALAPGAGPYVIANADTGTLQLALAIDRFRGVCESERLLHAGRHPLEACGPPCFPLLLGAPRRLGRRGYGTRATARLAGDDDEANRWQAIIDRHATMLSDPRRVVAFASWSSFH